MLGALDDDIAANGNIEQRRKLPLLMSGKIRVRDAEEAIAADR